MIRGIVANYSGYEINSVLDTDFRVLQKVFFDKDANKPKGEKVVPLDEFIKSL